MARQPDGSFTRDAGANSIITQATTGSKTISESIMDADFNDLTGGIDGSLPKNGSGKMSGSLDLNDNVIENQNFIQDLDLKGYKIDGYGNTDSVGGRLCEVIEGDVFTPTVFDSDGHTLGAGEFAHNHGYSQTIGDIVYFLIDIKFGTVSTTLVDDIFVGITSSGNIPFRGTPVKKFTYPCNVQGGGGLDRAIQGNVSTDGITTVVTPLRLSTAGANAITYNAGVSPSVNDTLIISGWYKIPYGSHLIPNT